MGELAEARWLPVIRQGGVRISRMRSLRIVVVLTRCRSYFLTTAFRYRKTMKRALEGAVASCAIAGGRPCVLPYMALEGFPRKYRKSLPFAVCIAP